MSTRDLLVAAINGAAATVLIDAGVLKLVAPGPLQRALDELLQGAADVPQQVVRLMAVVEVTAAVLLLALPTRTLGLSIVALSGLAFVILGLAGRLRRSLLPCGCMGSRSGQPLGAANVVVGGLLVGVVLVNAWLARWGLAAGYSYLVMPTVAVLVIGMSIWHNRRNSPIVGRMVALLMPFDGRS